jgi:hypothetical protein
MLPKKSVLQEFLPCKEKHKSFWGAFLQKGAMVL